MEALTADVCAIIRAMAYIILQLQILMMVGADGSALALCDLAIAGRMHEITVLSRVVSSAFHHS